ncbi:MAG: hypothetical protein AB7S99_14760 [Pseudodonghicola sp.]
MGLSRIANLRCPDCDRLQGVLPMRLTIRGVGPFVAYNQFSACPRCGARLYLVARHGEGGAVLVQALVALAALLGFGLIASLVAGPAFRSLGPSGAFVATIACFFLASGGAVLGRLRLYHFLYRVEKL